jgi:hypothetical protein
MDCKLTKIESLPVGIVSWLHIPEEDWDLLCKELTVEHCSLSSEAYIDFDWFTENESVRITLGRVFAELDDDRALDYDVYLIMREAGFGSHFCELVNKAKRAGMDYLIINLEHGKVRPRFVSRIDSGHVYHNKRLPTDHDIVAFKN